MRSEEPQRRLLEMKYTYLKIKETDKITTQRANGAINDVLEELNDFLKDFNVFPRNSLDFH